MGGGAGENEYITEVLAALVLSPSDIAVDLCCQPHHLLLDEPQVEKNKKVIFKNASSIFLGNHMS